MVSSVLELSADQLVDSVQKGKIRNIKIFMEDLCCFPAPELQVEVLKCLEACLEHMEQHVFDNIFHPDYFPTVLDILLDQNSERQRLAVSLLVSFYFSIEQKNYNDVPMLPWIKPNLVSEILKSIGKYGSLDGLEMFRAISSNSKIPEEAWWAKWVLGHFEDPEERVGYKYISKN